MSHELPSSLEIKFTPDQIKAIKDYEKKLQSLAENTNLPSHDGCPTSQKPGSVEVELEYSVEEGKLEVEPTVSGSCPTAVKCHSLWKFDLEGAQWEQLEPRDGFDEITFDLDDETSAKLRDFFRPEGDDDLPTFK